MLMGFIFRNKSNEHNALKTEDGLFNFQKSNLTCLTLPNGNILINGIEFDDSGLKWFYQEYTRGYHLSAVDEVYDIWGLMEIGDEHTRNKLEFTKDSFYFSDVSIWCYGLIF